MSITLDNVRILQKTDTSSRWESNNPILGKGEIGYDSTNKKIKIGDGTSRWNDLKYISADGDGSGNSTILDAIQVTENIGNYKNGNIINSGTSYETILRGMLSKEVEPIITPPSVSFTTPQTQEYEVGTLFKPTYTVVFNSGKYPYNDNNGATKVTMTGLSVSNGTTTKNSLSGEFDTFQITESTNYSLKASATYSDSTVIPVTNLGNPRESKQIKKGTTEEVTSGVITGYRAWFYGYKNSTNAINISNLDSNIIRNNLIKSNGKIPTELTTKNMKQMFFVIPYNKKNKITVINKLNGSPQTVTKLGKSISVSGANDSMETNYDVWYVNNEIQESGDSTFKITIE